MKKFFLFIMASLVTVSAMAIGDNDGSTKANAKEFDWNKGVTHEGGTLWYRVDLTPLYDEENPSLTLYLTNPSNVVGSTVDVSMTATVAGQEESKDYTIAARQYKTYTANAKALITLKQTEIYLTLTSKPNVGTESIVKLSAKVFETADLDETCKDARTLKWGETAVQDPMYSAWWKVSLKPIKDASNLDAQVTITNTGAKTVNLKMSQSLDCPSSGVTKREYTLAPGEPIVKKIPREMITGVQPDELYFGVENVESQVSILVETVPQPPVPVIPDSITMPGKNLRVTDTIQSLPVGTTLYKVSVADMDSLLKYEPEFTYRNVGSTPAKVTVQMSFSRPAYSTSDTEYDLAAGAEEIVVYKKNMLEGMEGVDSIYLLTTVVGIVDFYGRFKHVREGKACKTNIDFNWVDGHTQEARTTQWYAINVADARERMKDIMVYLLNQGDASATVKASMAFSCPYIDLTEMTRTLSAKSEPAKHRLGFSSYAMMSDTVWIGLETNQDIKFWADTVDAEKKAEVDYACEKAIMFDWKVGQTQEANDTVWYIINMDSVLKKTDAKFPTIVVENLNSSSPAKISAEMSLECPDSIENQSRSLTIAAGDTYSRKIARNMFENMSGEIYLRVVSTQKVSIKIRLSEEAEGTSCASAIPFNWVSGNSQTANSNLWYKVDMREAKNKDLRLTIENKDAAVCEGVGQLTFGCPDEDAPSTQTFTLASKETKTIFKPHSATELLPDGDSSIIYINLQGNTAMRISAERLTPAPFTPITGPSTSLDTMLLDSKETIVQDADTQWYLIPKEEILHLRDMNKGVAMTPNIRLENSGAAAYDVTIEVAFAFPITETMISQKVTVPTDKPIVHALDYKLFMQAITKFDSVLVRVTVPAEAAASNSIKIKSGMDKAFNGNTRETAVPIIIGEEFIQNANDTMWYKIKTSDLKKDKSLISKRLHVRTANLGSQSTTIKVAIFEGLQSKVDKLEEYGMESYREQKIRKGEDRGRDIPFQNLLMVGDMELYIQVTTTQKIGFMTKISGEYAPVADLDTTQYDATLLVPNVDYIVPGDNKNHWYQICIPYIRNNFKYTHESSITYEVDKATTVEVLNTVMDTMKYMFPSRKRTFSKHVNTMLLSDLIGKGFSKLNGYISDEEHQIQPIDVTAFPEDFIDSLLHRYVTSDSLTMYIRYKATSDVKVRLNMPQVKGDSCLGPVIFDWEHGYVNAAKTTNWIQIKMDATRVPENHDLLLHMDNWTDAPTHVKGTLYEANCSGNDLGKVERTIVKDTTKLLQRQFLEQQGWIDYMIEYYSDSTTHIWAELVDPYKRDTDYMTIDTTVCPMDEYTHRFDNYAKHVINPNDPKSWTWTIPYDSVIRKEAKITTFMVTFNVLPLQKPTLIPIESMTKKPVIKRGATVSVADITAEILDSLQAVQGDSIMPIDTIKWEYTLDGVNYKAFPTPVLTSTSIALCYKAITVCDSDSIVYSDTLINIPSITLKRQECGPYQWPEGIPTSPVYKKDTLVGDTFHLHPNGLDSIVYLDLKIKPVPEPKDSIVACKQYTWPVNNKTYTTSDIYEIKDSLMDDGCFHNFTLDLTIETTKKDSIIIDSVCFYYVWKLTGFDSTVYDPGVYYHVIDGGTNDCDTLVKLDVKKIQGMYSASLKLVPKYGDRLLLIDRKDINDNMPGWTLEEDQTDSVKWYKDGKFLRTGFYLTKLDGSVLDPGTYYAVVNLPPSGGAPCGAEGKTNSYKVTGAASAPALMPSLVRPGEDIRVVNLDPEQTTTIRIYTFEGLVHGSYTVTGEDSFTIKAAMDNGFYLVELYSDSYKSTLRYIVK